MQPGPNSHLSQSQNSRLFKSCQKKLGEDPIKSSSEQNEVEVKPKSCTSDLNFIHRDNLSPEERQKLTEAFKPHKNNQKKKDGFPDGSIRFKEELDKSEEVSLVDSESAVHDIPQRQQIYQRPKQKHYFNLMLIGAESTGKTTFMECFFKKYKQNSQEKAIKDHTPRIHETQEQIIATNLSLDFRIIDTPGYKHSNVQDYKNLILNEMKKRIGNYQQIKGAMETEKAIFQKEQPQIRDQRVHCCLFFLRGPRLHSDDWLLIKEIYDKCNIIPVIAKGDSYSIDEIAELKNEIRKKEQQSNVTWFNIEEYLRQKHESVLHLVTKGTYGVSPPFMISCSTRRIHERYQQPLGREYKWGICEIERQDHTEFGVLKKLLIQYLWDPCVRMTKFKQKQIGQDTSAKVEKFSKILKVLAPLGILCYSFLVIGKGSHLK